MHVCEAICHANLRDVHKDEETFIRTKEAVFSLLKNVSRIKKSKGFFHPFLKNVHWRMLCGQWRMKMALSRYQILQINSLLRTSTMRKVMQNLKTNLEVEFARHRSMVEEHLITKQKSYIRLCLLIIFLQRYVLSKNNKP